MFERRLRPWLGCGASGARLIPGRVRAGNAKRRVGLDSAIYGASSSTPGRARTYDPRIKSPLLYQLSYKGECSLELTSFSRNFHWHTHFLPNRFRIRKPVDPEKIASVFFPGLPPSPQESGLGTLLL